MPWFELLSVGSRVNELEQIMPLAACLFSEEGFTPILIFAFGSGFFFPLRQGLEPYRSRGMQWSPCDSA